MYIVQLGFTYEKRIYNFLQDGRFKYKSLHLKKIVALGHHLYPASETHTHFVVHSLSNKIIKFYKRYCVKINGKIRNYFLTSIFRTIQNFHFDQTLINFANVLHL